MNTLNDITAAGFCLCRAGAHMHSILPKTIWAQFFQKKKLCNQWRKGSATQKQLFLAYKSSFAGLNFQGPIPPFNHPGDYSISGS
jgi:hypothetical protein